MNGRSGFRGLYSALFGLAIPGIGSSVSAVEPLELAPREVEILSVMPRVTSNPPAIDPAWLYRGAIRPDGSFEAPLPKSSNEINRRQIELLRRLDKLRLVNPDGVLPDLGSIADKLDKPELLPIVPRTVK